MPFFEEIKAALNQHAIAFSGHPGFYHDDYKADPGLNLHGMSESRRNEFLSGRWCARQALSALGMLTESIPRGPGGEPVWPNAYCGSIAHTKTVCCAAAAQREVILSLGIDIERADRLISPAALEYFTSEKERIWLDTLTGDRPLLEILAFSIKEAVFKCWYQFCGVRLGLSEIMLPVVPAAGRFSVTLKAFPENKHSIQGLYFSDGQYVCCVAFMKAAETL